MHGRPHYRKVEFEDCRILAEKPGCRWDNAS